MLFRLLYCYHKSQEKRSLTAHLRDRNLHSLVTPNVTPLGAQLSTDHSLSTKLSYVAQP